MSRTSFDERMPPTLPSMEQLSRYARAWAHEKERINAGAGGIAAGCGASRHDAKLGCVERDVGKYASFRLRCTSCTAPYVGIQWNIKLAAVPWQIGSMRQNQEVLLRPIRQRNLDERGDD
jgi:hypothetical protein